MAVDCVFIVSFRGETKLVGRVCACVDLPLRVRIKTTWLCAYLECIIERTLKGRYNYVVMGWIKKKSYQRCVYWKI